MIGPDDIKGFGTKEELESYGYWVKETDEQYELDFGGRDPRMLTPLEMVTEFQQAMDQPLNIPWEYEYAGFRFGLIEEEYNELTEAEELGNSAETLKELADLVYVVYGYAATFGWDLDEAVRRVHESNMSKLGDDGKQIKRSDGKVIKGPNYKEPNLEDLV